jgi:ATP-binding cassette subfamily B protein
LRGVTVASLGYLVFAIGYVGALLVVVRGAVRGTNTPGDVVLAVGLAAQTNQLVFSVVETTHHLRRNARAAERLRWLRELVRSLYPRREEELPAPARLEDGIRLERVAFRYPGTDVDVLRDVDLELPAGTTVAFVGENGAGKTTLVKLLCRFYEPSGGRITVDGADLGRIDAGGWRARVAAGFQDFVRFELLARESIGVGELPLIDERRAVGGAVQRAAAGGVVDDLPDGLETRLGKTNGAASSSRAASGRSSRWRER